MKLLEQLEKLKNKNINFDNFKIDIGTAIDAPHSAYWILKEDDVFVLAVEPNEKNVNILKEGSFRKPDFNYIKLSDMSIMQRDKVVKKFNENNFSILEKIAIDNISNIEIRQFFCTDDRNTGCSSLLEPTHMLGLDIEKVDLVETVSLEYILNYINFPVNGKIKFIKTDTQGKDFDVIKSLGKYLENVVGIKSEYNTMGQYKNSNLSHDFYNFMISKDFCLVNQTENDFYFMNNKFKNLSAVFECMPQGI